MSVGYLIVCLLTNFIVSDNLASQAKEITMNTALEKHHLTLPHFGLDHNKKVPERIVCVAIKLTDGTIVLGIRYMDTHMRQLLCALHLSDLDKVNATRGFVTNKHRFVDSQEAVSLAVEKGQFIHRYGDDRETLYSQNLY